MLEVIGSCISCCLPRQMSLERSDEVFIRKYDEGTLATNHSTLATNQYAATGEREYHYNRQSIR